MSFPDDSYTARAETIVERTIERAFPLYADLRQHLLGLIRSATNYDVARELLENHGADVKFIKENAELLFESMATIDATGLATGISTGTTTISATLADVTGSTMLTVKLAPLTLGTATVPTGTVNTVYFAVLMASR